MTTNPMTALQLSRVAKEANGDCYFENKPIYVRTEEGLHAALDFTWDASIDGFVVATQPAEVKPPLPPEPPDGTVYSNGRYAVIRRDDSIDYAGRWWTTEADDYDRWDVVAEIVQCPGWRRYLPDLADDAPELPFKIWASGERSVLVEPSDAYADRLFVEVDSAHLVRKDVLQLAAALWSWAAREVETP